MNNIFASDNFAFCRIRFDKYHCTDNLNGSPMNYLAYMFKGYVKVVSKQVTITANEGELFFIPFGLSYKSHWYGNNEIDFLSFGFAELEAADKMNFNLQKIDCQNEIKELVKKIPVEGYFPGCKALGAFYTALSNVIPFLERNQSISKKEELINKAKRYILLNTDCAVSDIAKECNISEPYLYLLFKEIIGCTPNDYKLTVKCKKGADLLLTTDKTVEEISALTGFSSASHFRRVLKSKVGMTPKEMRKNSSF